MKTGVTVAHDGDSWTKSSDKEKVYSKDYPGSPKIARNISATAMNRLLCFPNMRLIILLLLLSNL